jgi:hypothetical protein
MEKLYKIPEYNFSTFQDKFNKLSNKAEKLKLSPVSYEVISIKFETLNSGYPLYNDYQLKFYNVRVSGSYPKLDGYIFIASIEHTESGNIIRSYQESLPLEFRESSNLRCDHCHIERTRNKTFIIKNTITEKYFQVGSQCLHDFLNTQNIENIMIFFESFDFTDSENYDNDDTGDNFRRGKHYFSIFSYLAYVRIAVNKFGWLSSSKGYINGGVPTKDIALDLMTDLKTPRITEEDITESKKIVKFIEDYLDSKKTLTDYENNIAVLIKNEYIQYSQVGYIASIIPLYNRILDENYKRKQELNNRPESNYIGKIGDKINNLKLTVITQTVLESQYGYTYLYNFTDDNGNRVSWFSSNDQKLDNNQTVIIKIGTIKDCKEYRGEKQTVITRCKIA